MTRVVKMYEVFAETSSDNSLKIKPFHLLQYWLHQKGEDFTARVFIIKWLAFECIIFQYPTSIIFSIAPSLVHWYNYKFTLTCTLGFSLTP